MTRKRSVVLVGSALVVSMALRPGTRGRRALHRATERLGVQARHLRGQWQGARYRLAGRHPDQHVSDLVLGDRVRSTIGPLQRRLDLPHIHVMVHDHVVLLHGEVAAVDEAETLEQAVRDVSGVRGVESYLHVGLLASDTRPSQGRAVHPPSEARKRLEAAARRGGAAGEGEPVRAVRAVLGTFFDRIPTEERDQVLAHLPDDVRPLCEPPRRHGARARMRTVGELVATVAEADLDLGDTRAGLVTDAVLGELAALVPEERSDVAAVLPRELAELWGRARRSTAHPEEAIRGA